MICTKKFVEVYNETFKFIHEELGDEGVARYWKRIGTIILSDLKETVEAKGLDGAEEYWRNTLTSEGALFEICLLPDCLALAITKCPSISHLENPYYDYCGHCDVMYRQLFESLGYKYEIEKSGTGSCYITVSK